MKRVLGAEYLDTAYFYYRDEYISITVAYRRKRTRDHVLYGAAFCHPSDQFNKKMGRAIAEGRMYKPSHKSYGSLKTLSNDTRFAVHDLILTDIEKYYPYGPEL